MNSALIIAIVVCTILSAFFSCVEMAYAKVNKMKLEREASKNKTSSKIALSFVNDYNNTITVILIGNNLVNIAASSIATILFVAISPEHGESLAVIVMSVIILIFGEIIPKNVATVYPYGISCSFSYPMLFFKYLLYPITFVVQKILNGFNKLLKKHKTEEVTDDELIEMVDSMEEQGLIDEDTQELITNAIDFIDVDAVEIMVHRRDVFGFDINDDVNELLNNPHLLDYSRIPVYDDNIDNILGILNTKELIKLHLNNEKIEIKELLTMPLYVYQTQSISDVLKELRQKHIHMCVVKDEYGGTMGILTMEDILEELVGEIYDEKDFEEAEEYHKVNKNKFTVDGNMNIYDFFDLINYKYDDDFESFYSTVGGWITDVLQHFPKEKDSFEFNGYKIRVMKASEFTVERVSVTKIYDESEEKE